MRQQQWIRDRQWGGPLESQKSKDSRKSHQGGQSNSHGFDREKMGNGPLSKNQRDRQWGGPLQSQKSKDSRKSHQGGGSNSHGYDRGKKGNGTLSKKQIVGLKRGGSKGGSANTKKQKIGRALGNATKKQKASEFCRFDQFYFQDVLKKALKKKEYKTTGISLTDMYGEYAKAVSKKRTKKKMFPLRTLKDKFTTRNGKYNAWVKESIEIVSSVYGKTIIKMKKR